MQRFLVRAAAFMVAAALALSGCSMTENDEDTPPPPPPSPPKTLDLEAGSNSIRATWTPSPQAEGYEVYYIGGNALPGTSPVLVEGGDAAEARIPDLEDDTTYYVWVTAYNDVGISKNSLVKSCTTYTGEKSLRTFSIGDIPGIINEADKTIQILVHFSTNLAQVSTIITLSPQATVSPGSGTAVDFSQGPVEFTVTAQNGTTQVYTVTVTKKGKASLTLAWQPNEGFTDAGTGAFTTADLVLAKGGPTSTADIDLQGSFTVYEWYVDNSLQGRGTPDGAADTPEVHLDAQDYLVGSHRLDLIAYDAAGIPYSKGLNFEVEN